MNACWGPVDLDKRSAKINQYQFSTGHTGWMEDWQPLNILTTQIICTTLFSPFARWIWQYIGKDRRQSKSKYKPGSFEERFLGRYNIRWRRKIRKFIHYKPVSESPIDKCSQNSLAPSAVLDKRLPKVNRSSVMCSQGKSICCCVQWACKTFFLVIFEADNDILNRLNMHCTYVTGGPAKLWPCQVPI